MHTVYGWLTPRCRPLGNHKICKLYKDGATHVRVMHCQAGSRRGPTCWRSATASQRTRDDDTHVHHMLHGRLLAEADHRSLGISLRGSFVIAKTRKISPRVGVALLPMQTPSALGGAEFEAHEAQTPSILGSDASASLFS